MEHVLPHNLWPGCSKYEVSDSEMSFGGEGEGGEEQDRAQLIAHFQVGRSSLGLCPEGRGIRWSCV